MAVTQRILGRKITTSPDPDWGWIDAGLMRLSIFENPYSEPLWIKRLGIRAGALDDASGQLRVVAYDAEGA